MEIAVTDHAALQRYEIHVDNRRAGILSYRPGPDGVELIHTEVPPEYEGRGIGSRLVRGALDDLRGQGSKVIPRCSFVTAFIRDHPEYVDLVVDRHRSEVTQ